MTAQAQTTWDLASQWSNSKNPNGVWSYNQGAVALQGVKNFNFAGTIDFPKEQPAWAPSNQAGNFLPVWLKAKSTITGYDWDLGDVVMHSTDSTNGQHSGIANVAWTWHGTIDRHACRRRRAHPY
jgi:hypothetical protein